MARSADLGAGTGDGREGTYGPALDGAAGPEQSGPGTGEPADRGRAGPESEPEGRTTGRFPARPPAGISDLPGRGPVAGSTAVRQAADRRQQAAGRVPSRVSG